MKITIIHGQAHKGVTYKITQMVLKSLVAKQDEIQEFFLPKDGPNFCCGCYKCFMKGEAFCPSADKVQPIASAIEWADIILLDSPNYVMEMSGPMKNLMDHLAYRWISHRPHGSMFTKTGIVVSSSAGAPPRGVVKSMARQLKWMCVPKVYTLGFACYTAPGEEINPKRKRKIEYKAEKIARAVKRRAARPRTGLREKVMFSIFRKMQSAPASAWNPTDRDWWVNHGWIEKRRPWKNNT
ncbi:MAG: NAD(P)H-dependent oxidoreductase [Clostridiales bacterium]|nr:NAD(P)H-dependent oxidoreductase [Clostridiales bacterium]